MSCPECFQGHEHEGTPRGKIVKLHGLDTYVSEPADGRLVRGVIVILPDAFGWDFVNNRILADHYADKGDYRVYLPDFMQGHSAPVWMIQKLRTASLPGIMSKVWTMGSIPLFLYAIVPFMYYNRPAAAYPRVKSFFTALRAETSLPIGIAGFCWGGKLLVMLGASTPEGLPSSFDAGFTGHPSMLSLPGDVEKLARPVAFALAEMDTQVPAPAVELIRKIVEGKPAETRGEVEVYEGCGHGFCVRADIATDQSVAQQAARAEDQCVRWFDKQFGLKA